MKKLSGVGFWRWLQTQVSSQKAGRSKKLRQRYASPAETVAAEVELMESRQLLTVTFHGGAVLASVEAQGVYLGSDFQNNASLHTQAGQLDQFVSTIVNSQYMDGLNQAGYNVGRGTSSAGVIVNASLNKSQPLTDATIQSDLQSLIQNRQVQAPDANRLYIVYAEPGVVVSAGGATSVTAFDGYHSTFVGKTATGQSIDIRYAVMAYPGSPNPTSSSQGFSSDFAQLTAVTSHELAEAVTNPDAFTKQSGGKFIGGWWDDALVNSRQGGEIGDITLSYRTTFNGYTVQEVSNRFDQPINPNQSGGTQGLTSPVLSAGAVSSTVAQLTWNSVAGAQGYRVYEMSGSQRLLLGTVSSTTTSVQVTGLQAGTKYSFQIEAYNATQIADSSWASVTTPAPVQTLTSPQVTAISQASSTVTLAWNYQAAAQGYRIYIWNGYSAILLGTVSGATTSVNVTGVRAGVTSYFLVEAFNSTRVADSAWVSVIARFSAIGTNSSTVPDPGKFAMTGSYGNVPAHG